MSALRSVSKRTEVAPLFSLGGGENELAKSWAGVANAQKEVNEMVAAAKEQGWRVKETTKGYLLYDPSGRHLETLHKTPRDPRGLRHSASRMRRYGFKWKGR